jgi:uncharacterized protein (TIGR02246 family)
MNMIHISTFRWRLAAVLLAIGETSLCRAQEAVAPTAIAAAAARDGEATVKAFNAADAAALGAMFSEAGELIDEAGTVHVGRSAITDLFARFFKEFPKSSLEMFVESTRLVGDAVVVEEGQRRITTADGRAAQVRYVAVRTKQGDRWPIASYREFSDDPAPTPREALQGVSWIVGDWVDESPEGRTTISFRWSDDGNFLIGEYTMSAGGAGGSKSTQRIGWDSVTGQLRSWTFDDDGGFTEGRWDSTDKGWVVRSAATMPDGSTGSATLAITVKDADRFSVRVTDRIIGGKSQPDFEMTIARRSPQPVPTK